MDGTFGNGRDRIMRSTVVCALALLAVSGCATTIKTNVLMPGRIDEAAKFKSVAVLPFDGTDGKEFSTLVESALAGVRIDDKQYFQIVDRSVMDKTLNEMKLSMTGVVDADTAARIGKMVGAKGIYTGTVTKSAVNDEKSTKEKTKCESYRKDSMGKDTRECARWKDVKIACKSRLAYFEVAPKLVDVESSRIVFANTYRGNASEEACEGEDKALPDETRMKQQVQEKAIQQLRMDVAPYYEVMEFTLKDSDKDIPSEAAKAKLKDGLSFAKGNRMDRACELWSEAKATVPNSVTLLYNLGVCAETQGRLEEARVLYQQIDRMQTKPDDAITNALARVNVQIENRKKLSRQVAK